ncbi:MAG: LytTR family DNA-binding domain-containing protein [Bacteroidota bacterium]
MFNNLIISDRQELLLIPENEIIHIRGNGSYCTIFVTNRKPITISKNLATIERQLKSSRFMRVHQSHLVNLVHIRSIDRSDGYALMLINGQQVPVARRRRDELLKRLQG